MRPGDSDAALGRRLLGIVVAVLFMSAAVLLGGTLFRPVGEGGSNAGVHLVGAADPIAEEADVFRTRSSDLAVEPTVPPRGGARPRTLSGFRALRAYPGAPPRIPHELGDGEFLEVACNQCHQRGGWVARFGAYAPVTPHPEYANCLQCHVPRATEALFRPTGWVAASWPPVGTRAMDGSPPVIPHPLDMRANCLACHGGAGAVAEVRTTHPGRTNCRQCHVPALTGPEPGAAFSRPVDGASSDSTGSGGGP